MHANLLIFILLIVLPALIQANIGDLIFKNLEAYEHGLKVCQALDITWSGGVPPYLFVIYYTNLTGLQDGAESTRTNTTSAEYQPDRPPGWLFHFALRDVNSLYIESIPHAILDAPDSSCVDTSLFGPSSSGASTALNSSVIESRSNTAASPTTTQSTMTSIDTITADATTKQTSTLSSATGLSASTNSLIITGNTTKKPSPTLSTGIGMTSSTNPMNGTLNSTTNLTPTLSMQSTTSFSTTFFSSPSPFPHSHHSISTATVAGSVVGGFFIIALLAVVLFCLRRHWRYRRPDSYSAEDPFMLAKDDEQPELRNGNDETPSDLPHLLPTSQPPRTVNTYVPAKARRNKTAPTGTSVSRLANAPTRQDTTDIIRDDGEAGSELVPEQQLSDQADSPTVEVIPPPVYEELRVNSGGY